MKYSFRLLKALIICFFLISPVALFAQSSHEPSSASLSKNESKDMLSRIEPAVTTSGSVTIDGRHIDYDAVAGTIPILDQNDQDTTARMGFVAYFKKGVTDMDMRPITFLYNGGPGSSTVWLHMGCFGPKRVVIDSTIHMHGAPYELVNNQYSLLDASDLVFIDMPGTGFGRIEPGHEKDYWGVDEDARAFGQFIMRFITKYSRWNSPKFVFGESYGTTRSAVLCNLLSDTYNIDLNGVVLLSQILDFGNSIDGPSGNPGDERPYELALPTYAATAWYHHKLPEQVTDLTAFLDKVEKFAMGEYAHALSQGSTLDSNTFNQIAAQLHQYTGLPVAYIKKANLRIDGGEFEQNLLGKQEEVTGRLDTRFSGPVLDPLAQRSYYDPQSSAISGAYIALFNEYVRKDLKYGKNMVYRPSVYGRMSWDWKHRGGMQVNVMPDLANAMKTNPKLQVMLNTGYFDLATPFYEGIYELQHLAIPRSLDKNIHYAFYESGHMVYVNVPSLAQLHKNVKAFINENYSAAQ